MTAPSAPSIADAASSLTDPAYLKAKFEAGLGYDAYLDTATDDQQAGWRKIGEKVQLTDAQKQLLGGFVRDIHVLAVSGAWCGDCVRQGPMIQAIAQASSGRIKVAWFDRDEHPDLQRQVSVNGGHRVPVAIFAAEDFQQVGWFGDKGLARYRVMAQQALGANCPLPGAPVPQNEIDAEVADWVDQFERIHLILRLSARLRKKHND
ncbi:MAG: thioredoxin family protein [Planctomycetota bacterium]